MGTKHARPTLAFLEIASDWAAGNGVPVYFTRTKGEWAAHFKRGSAVARVAEDHPHDERHVPAPGKTIKGEKRKTKLRPAETLDQYQHRMYDKFETAVDEAVAAVHRKWARARTTTDLIYVDKEPEFHVA